MHCILLCVGTYVHVSVSPHPAFLTVVACSTVGLPLNTVKTSKRQIGSRTQCTVDECGSIVSLVACVCACVRACVCVRVCVCCNVCPSHLSSPLPSLFPPLPSPPLFSSPLLSSPCPSCSPPSSQTDRGPFNLDKNCQQSQFDDNVCDNEMHSDRNKRLEYHAAVCCGICDRELNDTNIACVHVLVVVHVC